MSNGPFSIKNDADDILYSLSILYAQVVNPRLFDLTKSGGGGRNRYNNRGGNGRSGGNDRRQFGGGGGDFNRGRNNGYSNGNSGGDFNRNRSDGGSRFSNGVANGNSSGGQRYANGGTRFSNNTDMASNVTNGTSRFASNDTFKQNDFYQGGTKFDRPPVAISSAVAPSNNYQATAYAAKSNGYDKTSNTNTSSSSGGGANYQQHYTNGYGSAQPSNPVYSYPPPSYNAK